MQGCSWRSRSGWAGLLVLALGCGGPPVIAPPPPPPLDLSPALPIDAPLTAVIRPENLPAALPPELASGPSGGRALAELHRWLGPDRLARLGLDPKGPVWLSLRVGPVLAVLRTAEDAARIITERGPAAGGEAHAAGPVWPGPPAEGLRRALPEWLAQLGDPDGLAPAWVHLRLVGPAGPAPTNGFSAALGDALGGVLVARVEDPPETLAAALDTTPAAAAAAVAALDAPGLALYRLLDADPPMLVAIHRVGERATVDVIWDWDLGAGALPMALAALPERRVPDPARVPVPPEHRITGPLAAEERLRVRIDHAGWQQSAWMLGEVAALQAVLSQGRLRGDIATALAEARARARLPAEVLGPTGEAFRSTTLSLSRDETRWRARMTADYAPRAGRLAELRGALTPTAHGHAQDAAPIVLTIAATAGWSPVIEGVIESPIAPLALAPTLARCGPGCLPALWMAPVGWLAEPAAAAAAWAGMSSLEAPLADATGAHLALDPERGFAAMIGHPAPGTLARAAWAPLLADGQLGHRWVAGDRLVSVVVGDAPALNTALAGAHRGAPVVTTPVIQATFKRLPPAWGLQRLDLSVTFERAAMAIDAVFESTPPALPAP